MNLRGRFSGISFYQEKRKNKGEKFPHPLSPGSSDLGFGTWIWNLGLGPFFESVIFSHP